LAGDALQALAFELLTPDDGSVALALQGRLCGMLARAAGGQGMAGGQAIDLASVGRSIDARQLHDMHRLKTGALLQASVLMGAACGPVDEAAARALSDYGAAIGLAFQVVDDILDVTSDSQTLGKTAGKDAAQDKPTFVSLMGLHNSRNYAQELLSQARASLRHSGLQRTEALEALADKLVHRAF
jgi:farnesyl diphosphate synthase